MRITTEQLQQHLARELKPLYTVFGDETLLALEASDRIRARARAEGYTERDVLTVDSGFKWSELAFAGSSQSLFAARRILELRIPTGKPGTEGVRSAAGLLRRAAARHRHAGVPARHRLARAESRLVRGARPRRRGGRSEAGHAQGAAGMARRAAARPEPGSGQGNAGFHRRPRRRQSPRRAPGSAETRAAVPRRRRSPSTRRARRCSTSRATTCSTSARRCSMATCCTSRA